MNFFSLCKQNDPSIELKYNELIAHSATHDAPILESFCQRVRDESVITINMRPMNLLNFFMTGALLNINDWVEKIAIRSKTKDKDEILEEKLGDYYGKRKAFDEFFTEGEKLKYGALNINNGLGAIKYGEYCVVFEATSIISGGELGYLSADSLNQFVSDSFEVDEEGIKQSCVTDTCKQLLATIKHSDEVLKNDSTLWAKVLCNNSIYIEAIFSSNINPSHISSIRISKMDYDLYWEYAFEEFRGNLTELDRYRVDSFSMIDENLLALSLNWEIVDND